ncbi:MAG: hypothetical protein GOMPHAMPRED_003729 [Gomphillus americanus]|uniref:Methyltransferase domain-containing protein n=1 Tax=Gomphillus americanus TaxID=1940652 RepID=A0A8H3IRM3_9LECA|nr:MAG: hypothetical protein GOMPHAMPRED_003729 [Gomphillus americanus]
MASAKDSSSSVLSATKIASYAIQNPRFPNIEISQVSHRIRLVTFWDISDGARVLEIGCGQGNCTTVLAEAVGPTGHIDAVDPAPGDYGAPFTLAQAQAHITASEIGNRITWHQADPVQFLAASKEKWDFVVLSHCVWYFKSPSTLKTIFDKLVGRTGQVCFAEYALNASRATGNAHVLAALTRATLEAHRDSSANIQSPLSPAGIKTIALESQCWELSNEKTIIPESDLDDGRWEVGDVAHSQFLEEVKQSIRDERINLLVKSMRDAVLTAIEANGGKENIYTMDVWAGVFKTTK